MKALRGSAEAAVREGGDIMVLYRKRRNNRV
jgi:hypothetical protein